MYQIGSVRIHHEFISELDFRNAKIASLLSFVPQDLYGGSTPDLAHSAEPYYFSNLAGAYAIYAAGVGDLAVSGLLSAILLVRISLINP